MVDFAENNRNKSKDGENHERGYLMDGKYVVKRTEMTVWMARVSGCGLGVKRSLGWATPRRGDRS